MTHAEQRAKLVEMMVRALAKEQYPHVSFDDFPTGFWDVLAGEAEAILAALHGHYIVNAVEVMGAIDEFGIGRAKDLSKPEGK